MQPNNIRPKSYKNVPLPLPSQFTHAHSNEECQRELHFYSRFIQIMRQLHFYSFHTRVHPPPYKLKSTTTIQVNNEACDLYFTSFSTTYTQIGYIVATQKLSNHVIKIAHTK